MRRTICSSAVSPSRPTTGTLESASTVQKTTCCAQGVAMRSELTSTAGKSAPSRKRTLRSRRGCEPVQQYKGSVVYAPWNLVACRAVVAEWRRCDSLRTEQSMLARLCCDSDADAPCSIGLSRGLRWIACLTLRAGVRHSWRSLPRFRRRRLICREPQRQSRKQRMSSQGQCIV